MTVCSRFPRREASHAGGGLVERGPGNVISTLIGVVVGGLLTLVGSMLTSARDVRRQRRQRIYEELLPGLDKLREWGHEEGQPAWFYDDQVWSWLTALRRSVTLAGAH